MLTTIIRIALGLFGLGIVVFVHELGHFIAACLAGIEVEAFSIGWGKPFLKKKIGSVEYRLGVFPIGGYCKMKDQDDLPRFDKNNKNDSAPIYDKGSFFAAGPLRRIIVHFAGPFANIIFAILVLSFIWGIGFETYALENRIVLFSEITPGANPADFAGLMTGDRIIEIKGRKTNTFQDLQENIAINAEVPLPIKVERNGLVLDLEITPSLDRSTGAGRIGVLNWTEPVIGAVTEESPAEKAGLLAGDRILNINGMDFPYTVALMPIMEESPESLFIQYERDGQTMYGEFPVSYNENGTADLGIVWQYSKLVHPPLNPVLALVRGTEDTWNRITTTVRSLSLLFKGIDLTQAVSGPIRITYMIGDAAASGFGQSLGLGLSYMANFLALISIALCVMNLLPLPVLDGGMIIIYAIEAVRGKPIHPRVVNVFQTVGIILIFSLMIFAVFGDILFIARR